MGSDLESRIDVLPQLHEATVVLGRVLRVAGMFVQLTQPEESRRETTELIARFERVEFGGRAPAPEEAQRWIARLGTLVEEIEDKC